MMDKIGDDVVCADMPFAPITVGGRGGKGKQMQALLQLLQVILETWPASANSN
jgi:hypothetical protein